MQKARQDDYWDTFSLHLEDSEDPAGKNSALAEQLSRNQEIAKKKMDQVFEEYVRIQDNPALLDEESVSASDDTYEEDDAESEQADDKTIASDCDIEDDEDDQDNKQSESEQSSSPMTINGCEEIVTDDNKVYDEGTKAKTNKLETRSSNSSSKSPGSESNKIEGL